MFVYHGAENFCSSSNVGNTSLTERRQAIAPAAQSYRPLLDFSFAVPYDEIFLGYYRSRVLQGPDAEEIVTHETDRNLSNASELALATTFFGAEHRDGHLFQHGLRRYSRVLEQLNAALSDPIQSLSYDLLEAVVTLSLFEVSISKE